MGQLPVTDSAATADCDRAEAARYALLRRLAPSIRHNLVINLQPIGMIYEVLDRRLRGPQPDLAHVQASAAKINTFARAALNSCLNVVTWLAPEESAVTDAVEGTRECSALLATTLSFRGYTLRNQAQAVPGEVRLSAVRNVLTATLIQLTDEASPPAEVAITTASSPQGLQVQLQVQVHRTEGDSVTDTTSAYRPLRWTDVEALAASEQVMLERPSTGRVVITFPWASPRPA
jgi:hypothetical protein